MKQHVKIFLQARNLTGFEEYQCDWCGFKAETRYFEVHHIDWRGMGGDKSKDTPENLACMCPNGFPNQCHSKADANQIPREDLKERVRAILKEIR